MRIVFVLGTSTGGAARSTHALADALSGRSYDVAVLERDKSRTGQEWLYKKLTNMREHRRDRVGFRTLEVGARLPGRRLDAVEKRSYPCWRAAVVENALTGVLTRFAPDIVVAASISRLGWVRVHEIARLSSLPTVLYLREAVALKHLEPGRPLPDLLLANAEGHAAAARARGLPCGFVPSLVDTSYTSVKSSRAVAMLVNPRREHGVDLALDVAAARPDIPFVLQESWLLNREEKRHIESRSARLRNVEFRPFAADNSLMYRDARVLLVPHQMDNRPRVVLEAQSNGIPVLATDWPGLRESVGNGGMLLPSAARADSWTRELSRMWDDRQYYRAVSFAAQEHATRVEVRPDVVLESFVAQLSDLLAGRVGGAL